MVTDSQNMGRPPAKTGVCCDLLGSVGVSFQESLPLFHITHCSDEIKRRQLKLVHKTNSFAVLTQICSFVFTSEARVSSVRWVSVPVGQQLVIPPIN